MGTDVQKTTGKMYTDASGVFYEGMKRNEAEDKTSLFINYGNRFDKIDKDRDGVLSKAEITAEIESDIKAYRTGTKWMCGLGIVNALFGMATNKTASTKSKFITFGVTMWCLYSAFHDKKTADKLGQRAALGYN